MSDRVTLMPAYTIVNTKLNNLRHTITTNNVRNTWQNPLVDRKHERNLRTM